MAELKLLQCAGRAFSDFRLSWQQRIVSGDWRAAGSERDLPRACAVTCIVAGSRQVGRRKCVVRSGGQLEGTVWRRIYLARVIHFQLSVIRQSLGWVGVGESSA